VNVVPGYGETAGAALAAHPDVDKIAFTGSTEVGRLILQAAAGNLKKVSLELGGKSPNVVFGDVDLDAALRARPAPSSSTTVNAVALVHDSTWSTAFSTRSSKVCRRSRQNPRRPGVGIIHRHGAPRFEEQLKRVCGYLESGFADGAKAVVGGSRQGDKGYFVKRRYW